MEWIFWLIAAVLLGITELVAATFVLMMFAGGAAAAALAAALGAPVTVQAAVFVAVSFLGVFVVRPWARKLRSQVRPGEDDAFGVEALEGAPAVVLERVDVGSGLVQVAGQEWSAQSFDGVTEFEPGEEVNIVKIRGATAMVWRQR